MAFANLTVTKLAKQVQQLQTAGGLDADITAIAALDSAQSGVIASDGAGWVRKTYANLKTALSLTKADVGLSAVDNTADSAKPVSSAQQTALDAKATDAAVAHLTGNETIAGVKTLNGTLVADDATKGVALRSADNHYWRITVGNDGTLATTDLGTTRPTA